MPEKFTERELWELYWANGKSLSKIAKEKGVSTPLVSYYMDKYGIPRRGPPGRPPRNVNIDWDEYLAFLIGLIEAEGSISDPNGQISISQAHREILEEWKKIFLCKGMSPGITYYKRFWKLQVCSRQFTNWYLSTSLAKKGERILSDKNFCKAFIAGYFAGDGCVTAKTNVKLEVSFKSTDKKRIELVERVLEQLGVKSRIYLDMGPYGGCYTKKKQHQLKIRKYKDAIKFVGIFRNYKLGDIDLKLSLQKQKLAVFYSRQ